MEHIKKDRIEVHAENIAKGDNRFCGDSYFFHHTDEYFICVLADGLGSGEFAFDSSSAVAKVVQDYHDQDVESLMNLCNKALENKRGAAVSILKVYYESQEFVYSCVGNIRFYLYSPDGKMTYPLPITGFLSGRPQAIRVQRFPYLPNSRFLIHSDGLVISGTKSLLQTDYSIDEIKDNINLHIDNKKDDTTYIIGGLL